MKTKEQLDADTLFAFQMALKGHKQFEYHNGVKWSPIGYIVSSYPHRIYHDIPKGWTRHDGEDWNGDGDSVIEQVMWMDGEISSQKSRPAKWWRDNGGNSFTEATPHRIYAYKLAEKPEKKVIPWTVENFPRNLWVKRKGGDSEYLAIAVCKERGTLYLGGEWVNFYKLMSDYLQPDNSPCGTEVEQ